MKKVSLSSLFLVILFIGMSIIAFTLWMDKIGLKDNIERLRDNQNHTTNTIVEKYTDKVDTFEHVIFQDRIVTRGELKKGHVPIDQGLLDSMIMGLKMADGKEKQFKKRINELTRVNATLQGTIKGMKGKRDDGILIDFKSKYLNATVDTSLTMLYKYQADLRFAAYEEPTGFLGLGKPKYYVDVSSPDPNFATTSIDRFRVQANTKKRPWGLGLIAGWTIDPTIRDGELRLRPAIGFGLSYSIARF